LHVPFALGTYQIAAHQAKPLDSEGDLKFKYIKMVANFRQEQVQMSLLPLFSVIIFQFSLIDAGLGHRGRYQHDY